MPDLVISHDGVSRTYDLKIISYGAQYRQAAEVAAPRQARAVNARADKVPGAYLRAAQKLDREAVGVAPGAVGPIESALRTHGGVTGLALGAYGEASQSPQSLHAYLCRPCSQIWLPLHSLQ